jgi:hypothetical protein
MPNTIDSALIASTISEQAQTVLGNRLAALNLFSSDFSSEVKKPKDTIQVPVATATSSTQTNPTSFNSTGGTTLDKATVALDHLYQPFGLDYSDIQSGIKLEKLVKINLNALADKIWAVVTTPITVANYGSAVVAPATASANFAAGDLAKLWASVSKSSSKGLVLSPTLYSGIIPTATSSTRARMGSTTACSTPTSSAVRPASLVSLAAPRLWRLPPPLLRSITSVTSIWLATWWFSSSSE